MLSDPLHFLVVQNVPFSFLDKYNTCVAPLVVAAAAVVVSAVDVVAAVDVAAGVNTSMLGSSGFSFQCSPSEFDDFHSDVTYLSYLVQFSLYLDLVHELRLELVVSFAYNLPLGLDSFHPYHQVLFLQQQPLPLDNLYLNCTDNLVHTRMDNNVAVTTFAGNHC